MEGSSLKVIITGATGFLGRNLAEALHRDGVQVIATGRSLTIGRALREQGIDFRPADLLDPSALAGGFEPAGCVIHCAARSGDWGRYREFFEANVVGTRNVVKACRTHGIGRLLFVSTPSLYFTGADRYDVREDEPLPARQATHYAQTKRIAESELAAIREQGCRVLIFRPKAVLGPHDSTFVPRILRLSEKGRVPLINGGEALVDITYVDNLVDATRAALAADDSAWNEAYNISNGEPIRVRDWFRQILEQLGRPFRPRNVPAGVATAAATAMEIASYLPFGPREPALTRFAVGYMARSMTLSLDKARNKLGYSPAVSNREGFERLAQWHRAQAR